MATKAQRNRFINNADEHQREIVHIIQALARRHDISRIWSDWIEMGALSIANAVDKGKFDEREKRYLDIIKRYNRDELDQLVAAFAHLVQCWELRVQTGDYGDVLGSTFMMLDMGNERAGQFFTPYEVSRLMGQMLGVGADIAQQLAHRDFVRLMEPACGAGGMIVASAQAMREAGQNYQQQLHVTAIDIDLRCVHMTYLQLALLHIPAIVIHGNALSVQEWDHWATPAHVIGQWDQRLQRGDAVEAMLNIIRAQPGDSDAAGAEAPQGRAVDERVAAAALRAVTTGQMQLF